MDGRRAWLMLAAGEDRQHGGNDGYDDSPSECYRWDSTVPNATKVSRGDIVLLWNKRHSIGMSTIESVDAELGVKELHRCPRCEASKIKARRSKAPRFRCHECSFEFEVPNTKVVEVCKFASRHSIGWTDLEGAIDGALLRRCCFSPRSQLSMRPLDLSRVKEVLTSVGEGHALRLAEDVRELVSHGHVQRVVRVRRGQAEFRRSLLDTFGSVCAFSGHAPPAALEAAHLYSYGDLGFHHSSGGLLLRRDLHALFDCGGLSVDQQLGTIDLRQDVMCHEQYRPLHGAKLKVHVDKERAGWLQLHWAQHRS